MNVVLNRRFVVVAAMLVTIAGCRKRAVDVRTAPSPTPSQQQALPTIQVNSTLAQAVNVYVTFSGADTFLRQVSGNSSVSLPVQGIPAGSTVTLKAVTIDGSRTYTRGNVVLSGTIVFPLP